MSTASAEFIAPVSDLGGIVEGLAEPRRQIESVFLSVGDLLTQSAGILEQISTTFEALPNDLDRPELHEATARLTAVGNQAGAFSQSFVQEQRDIERLVEVVAQANRPIEELRRSIRMMGILAINARVVAASVSNLEDSDVFTTDIAELSASAAKTIAEFSQIYEKVRLAVQQAAAARARFEGDHSRSLAELSRKISASLADLAHQRQRSADGSAQTLEMSRAIGQRVMTAVMALQVGDSTRQRVAHVETALGRGEGHDETVRASIGELCAELLIDAVRTLDTEVVEAQQALADLARDARAITARSREVYGEAGEDGSVLGRLNDDMRQAVHVLQDCDRERQVLAQVAAGVEAAVRVLLRHVDAVQTIEGEMRLVSLNAAIRCAQLGPEGAALNVISRQLRDLTAETVEAAETAASGLNEAAELALAFSAASGEEAAERMAQLERDAVAGLGLMEGVESRLRNALAILADAGPRVADLLDGASQGFDAHQAISEALMDTQIRIAALGVTPSRSVEPGSALADILGATRKSYTMGAERQIHDRMWGAAPALTVVAAVSDADDLFEDFDAIAPTANEAGEDDLGLDLFDTDEPAAPSGPETVAAMDEEALGTVEDDVMFF